MYQVVIYTKTGNKVRDFRSSDREVLVGRAKEIDIPLHGWRVQKHHAKITYQDGLLEIEGLAGNKIIVNENKVERHGPIQNSDSVEIGDYRLSFISNNKSTQPTEPQAAEKPAQAAPVNAHVEPERVTEVERDQASSDLALHWRSKIHNMLLEIMDLRRIDIGRMSDDKLREFTSATIHEIVSGLDGFPDELDKREISRQVLAEAIGLGPLEDLIEREDISEIMVNSRNEIFYEQAGKIKKSTVTFTDDKAVIAAIERIVAPLGRRIDESSPMVDARLKDGSRVNAVIPPLSLKGPCITIRKFMKNRLQATDLIRFNSISQTMVEFLEIAITQKRNVIISGGTGSGKTTLLNMLSNYIPNDERVITVEDAAELTLYLDNLVQLEARPPNQEGSGAVHIRDLVKNCLRMRPDRIVVGECRGGEALDMLQAMNTGHDGSLTTVHSNSPRDCISRLEVLVLMSGMDLPVRAIREQIASAVNIIVQQTRFSCGSRKVTAISEVTGVEGDRVQLSDIFRFRQTGYGADGKVQGVFEATGVVPEFYEDLARRGIDIDMSIFSGSEAASF